MELSNTSIISIKDRKYQQATLTLDSGEEIQIDGYDNIGKCFHGDFEKWIHRANYRLLNLIFPK